MARLGSQIREVLDWRFLVALSVLILVVVTSWGYIDKQNENAALASSAQDSAHSISVLTSKVDLLTDQLAAQRAAQSRASQKASKARATLRRQNRAMAHALAGLLGLLKQNGITVPQSFISDLKAGGSGASSKHPRRRPSPCRRKHAGHPHAQAACVHHH